MFLISATLINKTPGKNGPPKDGESSTDDNSVILGGILALAGGVGILLGIPGFSTLCTTGVAMVGWKHAEDSVDYIPIPDQELGIDAPIARK